MKRPTLLGRILRVQTGVVVLACSLLVVSAGATAAALLRSAQDDEIGSLAAQVCQALSLEYQAEGHEVLVAAREIFRETRIEGFRYELVDPAGRILVESGELEGWDPSAYVATPSGRVATPRLALGGATAFRTALHPCVRDFSVRVATRDALSRPETRRAAIAVILALPVAILAAALIGRAMIRSELRPLQDLETAAARIHPGVIATLGVGARAAELASLERTLDELVERLGEALARERRFTQEASHELRTPLTVVRAWIEQIVAHDRERDDLAPDARAALKEVDSLDALVEALLLLARSESAPLPSVPINVCDLAREAAHRQLMADGPGSPAPVVDAPDEILVRGSEELLSRAVGNLVENARKFSGPAGRIHIRVISENGFAILTVADDGPGIADEHRPFVFERFFRGPAHRNVRSGAGLGLAVAKAIVVRHRGAIDSQRGSLGGEEFRVSLPLLTQETAPAPPTA